MDKENAVPTLTINGIEVEVERGTTVLEAARFLGIPIPTLCHDDGLVPYGACRLCLVEVSNGKKRNLQASCCLPAEDGMVVFTHSARVERARRLLVEMYVATCPQSKRIQDMASAVRENPASFSSTKTVWRNCSQKMMFWRRQRYAGVL